MLIDWFTVGAQILNFLILVWLMKRYLYQPVLDAIDAREKRITAKLADADKRKAEADKQCDDFQKKNADFDQQQAGMLSKAADEAKAERQRLIEEARKAADALSAKRDKQLRSDAKSLNDSIARRTQDEVFAIAKKALTELAGAGLEAHVCEVFAKRLRSMDDAAKAKLAGAIKSSSDATVIRSAFGLPPEQRESLQNLINETFSADVKLRFEVAPETVAGIELSASGQKVAWSIAGYLANLEQGLADLLAKPVASEKSPAAVSS